MLIVADVSIGKCLFNQSMNQLKYRFKAMTKASVFVLRSPKFMQSLVTTYSHTD